MTLLEAALDYIRRGWAVLPLEPGGKRPLGGLVAHGLKDANTSPEQIQTWWEKEPWANVGLVTGIAFDVIDVDGPEALEALESWSENLPGDDVEGPTVMTPRGWHCYLKPTGNANGVNLGGLRGIDWRGRNGYVVAPPSVKDDGTSWDWVTGTQQDRGPDTPILAAPKWLLALFGPKSGRETRALCHDTPSGQGTERRR